MSSVLSIFSFLYFDWLLCRDTPNPCILIGFYAAIRQIPALWLAFMPRYAKSLHCDWLLCRDTPNPCIVIGFYAAIRQIPDEILIRIKWIAELLWRLFARYILIYKVFSSSEHAYARKKSRATFSDSWKSKFNYYFRMNIKVVPSFLSPHQIKNLTGEETNYQKIWNQFCILSSLMIQIWFQLDYSILNRNIVLYC